MQIINKFIFLVFLFLEQSISSYADCQNAYSFLRWPTNDTLCANRIVPEASTFESLIGLEKQKQSLSSLIEYFKKPASFQRADTIPCGYLFTGPSCMRFDMECFCNALVNELNKNRNKSMLFSYYVIHPDLIATIGIEVFAEEIKRHAPCIIYIHDIDELALQRLGSNRRALQRLLNIMDMPIEADGQKQVIFLAVTNRPENLCFDNKSIRNEIRFDFPNFQDRKALFKKVLKRFKVDFAKFDFDQLAAKTEACSFRDLLSVIKASLSLANKKRRPFTQKDLEETIDREIHRIVDET